MKKAFFALLIILVGILVMMFVASKLSAKRDGINVYFIKSVSETSENVVPVKRPTTVKADTIKVAVNELLKGPTAEEKNKGYLTEIPANTKLISVENKDNTAIVNISKDFVSGGGSESMTLRLKQLTYTIKDASSGKKVFLEIDGKKVSYIGGEGVPVQQPLSGIKK